MSSFCKCKSYSHFFSKNISVYGIFNDESFNDKLTNDIVSFEQLARITTAFKSILLYHIFNLDSNDPDFVSVYQRSEQSPSKT